MTVTTISNEPGGFGRRLLAVIIDGFVLQIILFPIGLILQIVLPLVAAGFGDMVGLFASLGGTLLSLVINMAGSLFYYFFFYTKKGATPGKMLLKLKVINQETGEYLNLKEVFLREIVGKLLSALLLMIGFLMVLFRDDKRALHDIIAGSQVLRSE